MEIPMANNMIVSLYTVYEKKKNFFIELNKW